MMHCPRCKAPLPDPPEKFCPSCGVDLELAASGMPPTAPYSPSDWAPPAGADPGRGTPWERHRELGYLAAFIETTQQVLMSPAAFFRAMPVAAGIGLPLVYAWIVGYVGVVVAALYDFVLQAVMGPALTSLGQGAEGIPGLAAAMGSVSLGMKLLLGIPFILVKMFLVTAVVHLALLALGAGTRGFEATFRVVCYSEAAALLNIIPICGGLLEIVAKLVIMIIGISEAQATTRGRATAAVLLPVLVCCCCVAVPMAGVLASLAAQIASQMK